MKAENVKHARDLAEEEVSVLIGARFPLIYIVSWEEDRVLEVLAKICQKMGKALHVWSVSTGLKPYMQSKPTGHPGRVASGSLDLGTNSTNMLLDDLNEVQSSSENAVFVFKDMHHFLDESRSFGDAVPKVVRKIRDVCKEVIGSKKSFIALSSKLIIPSDLEKDVTVVDFPLPDMFEVRGILDRVLNEVKDTPDVEVDLSDVDKEKVVKAALGLTALEIENVFAKAIVKDSKFNKDDLSLILKEKQQIIRKSGLLEYYEAQECVSQVGGLNNLKAWITKRARSFTEEARDYGLPAPKGVLLLGVQGCGKSLCAKSVSTYWQLPLLRLDMGAIYGKYIGESESNIRLAIKTAESISPAILWMDELEKGLAGLGGSEDGGTSSRVFGTLLTWMQEKTKPVFVIATANNVSKLPAELLRKGRFDEIFFVDLPDDSERLEIFGIHLVKRGRKPENYDLNSFIKKSEGFSGAEIEQAIVSAMFDAFDQSREFNSADILASLSKTVPLSSTMREPISALRSWAMERAVSAK